MDENSFTSFLATLDHIVVLQWIAVIFGVLQVWFAKENKPITYLYGIVSILLNIYVLYFAKLYAEMFLSLYYLIMSIYGWWYWMHGRHRDNKPEAPISYSNSREWVTALIIVFVSFVIFYSGLISLSDSDVPLWDSLVTAFAWAGMWLLAKRKMENWIFLNISNAIAIPLLYHKGLAIFAAFTLFLFLMAIWGYMNWYKIIKREKDGDF